MPMPRAVYDTVFALAAIFATTFTPMWPWLRDVWEQPGNPARIVFCLIVLMPALISLRARLSKPHQVTKPNPTVANLVSHAAQVQQGIADLHLSAIDRTIEIATGILEREKQYRDIVNLDPEFIAETTCSQLSNILLTASETGAALRFQNEIFIQEVTRDH